MEPLQVLPFEASRREDFFRLHSEVNGCGWCRCVAWWVPTWEGWGERTEAENLRLREALLERGEYDGHLLYAAGECVGWCQVGPRDRLTKLVRQLHLDPDPETWAITCFLIAPGRRRSGFASALLAGVIADLRKRGVRRVEAYPKRGDSLDVEDLWTGPEAMYRAAGFRVARDDAARPVLALSLDAPPAASSPAAPPPAARPA